VNERDEQLKELTSYFQKLTEYVPAEGTVSDQISQWENKYERSSPVWSSCVLAIQAAKESVDKQSKNEVELLKKQLTDLEEKRELERKEEARVLMEKETQLRELAQILREVMARPKEGSATSLITQFEKRSREAKWHMFFQGKKIDNDTVRGMIDKVLLPENSTDSSPSSTSSPASFLSTGRRISTSMASPVSTDEIGRRISITASPILQITDESTSSSSTSSSSSSTSSTSSTTSSTTSTTTSTSTQSIKNLSKGFQSRVDFPEHDDQELNRRFEATKYLYQRLEKEVVRRKSLSQ